VVLAVALLGALSSGCYLLQSAAGEWSLLSRRVPIGRMLADPATPAAVRRQLTAVAAIRSFAVTDLELPDNGSYRSYADVQREYVVWNVVAAPEFSVQPHEWCYPIVGCVAYRGYFVEGRARRLAVRLEERGEDVEVAGVAAFSTLGHFDDPVISTMLGWSDVELAAIIFHELTHQLIYLPDDSDFDEALATTVEETGVHRWLAAQHRFVDLERFEVEQRRRRAVLALIERTRGELEALYAEPLGDAAKRTRKTDLFAQLRERYREMRRGWGSDHAPFSEWFEGPLNNASIASVATYYRCVPGFERELAAAGGDLPVFYRRVKRLAAQPQAQRDAQLCGGGGAA
jgi:predicted aminopeptidase